MNDKLPKMVGWYDPLQLIDTAGKTIVSTIIGENADQRLTNASLTHQPVFDYSFELEAQGHGFEPTKKSRQEIWIDYVADPGDGWNSTATIAHYLAAGAMPSSYTGPGRRGDLMIFGGDEVYPTGSQEEYEKRLVAPYEQAAKASGITVPDYSDGDPVDLGSFPHVFAVPGNHDWYDSLYAFRYLFCAPYFNERIFADGWRTRQQRSYFAIKLPYDWWIFGLDFQLTHNLDWAQLEYFSNIIRNKHYSAGQASPSFEAGSKVIVCSPEPLWVYEEKYKEVSNATPYTEKTLNLHFLERLVLEAKSEVRLYLAGDSHHYRRFASDDDRLQRITAGGGGAFLHPTHDITFGKITADTGEPLTLRKSYPDVAVSKGLGYKNLLFPVINPKFGSVCLVLYGMVVALRFVDPTLAVVITGLLIWGLVFFTDTNSKLQKWFGGLLHGAFHVGAILLLAWAGYHMGAYLTGSETTRIVIAILVSAVLGWPTGSFIMGGYLAISLQAFGRHGNEAFSSLKIEDYKNFVRLHLTSDGLRIYPLKIEKVQPCTTAKGQEFDCALEFIESGTILSRNSD